MSLKRASPNAPTQKDSIDRLAREYEDNVTSHLAAAFKRWSSLPATQQHETYHLEILRAFAREAEKRKSVDAQLVRVQQEADHLRAQVEKLSACQNPREFTLLPPETMVITRPASRELHSASSKFEDWDYDRLVHKWQGVVKSDRRNKNNLASQRMLPTIETGTGTGTGGLGRSLSTPGGRVMTNGHGHTYSSTETSPVMKRDSIGIGNANPNSATHAVHFLGECERGTLPTPQSGGPLSGVGSGVGSGRVGVGSVMRMNGAGGGNNGGGTTNEDADGEDDSDTGYGQVLMEMSGGGRGGAGVGRVVEMEDAK